MSRSPSNLEQQRVCNGRFLNLVAVDQRVRTGEVLARLRIGQNAQGSVLQAFCDFAVAFAHVGETCEVRVDEFFPYAVTLATLGLPARPSATGPGQLGGASVVFVWRRVGLCHP